MSVVGGEELCSLELKTTNKSIQDCEVSNTKPLTGSKVTFSARYNGGRCYSIWVEVPDGSSANIPCSLDGVISEEFYASNGTGTKNYVLHVNGDPQASCAVSVTTKGSVIKQAGGHEYWNTDVACNDSLFISVDDGDRTLVCKSENSSNVTIVGDGFGSASNTCNGNNCSYAQLQLCYSGAGKCERVVRTSCNGSLKCWVP